MLWGLSGPAAVLRRLCEAPRGRGSCGLPQGHQPSCVALRSDPDIWKEYLEESLVLLLFHPEEKLP